MHNKYDFSELRFVKNPNTKIYPTLLGEIMRLNYLGYQVKCETLKNEITVTISNDVECYQPVFKYNHIKERLFRTRKQTDFFLSHLDFFITNEAIKEAIGDFWELKNPNKEEFKNQNNEH